MSNYRKYRDVGRYNSVLAWLYSANANISHRGINLIHGTKVNSWFPTLFSGTYENYHNFKGFRKFGTYGKTAE
jgi:hypothetical protein